ncbi:undecaprenyl/decaprenyl-phosphate alpha-N-acetylglucosaminyl 1-phosphate transferase [Gracilibacillus caseinilyticus]|uniref:Undecaprenyl/decaprenyl-phosphate alpha-N-acetylglucosaminyl 1-phosphate transferase n=1 Tax=Gracilibacillus caseinilyticus TaxID=2932256 RepID=A0ABY4F2I7_9BACI|nr:MraY family glycosyltransferase [Gracilibacillus caseinilyticus]UOQ50282.1 undecaprenyl/decaprenyl-phosphate alpha-N-acetylglucosaminyl 1-phosphate transferase [Gracilibacillus caseinilyticus]
MNYILPFILCLTFALILTPLVKKLAIKIGAVDKPNARKVHQKLMPRLGGLAIYVSFLLGYLIFQPVGIDSWPLLIGGTMIVILGVLDDLYELSAKIKFIGQIVAASITVVGGMQINFIVLPFTDKIEFGFLAVPITIIWIVAITNAINLIDGLDGLAAGVSSIALLTIVSMSFTMGNLYIAVMALLLLGSTLGFLWFNFNPAKIFMGDTGSMFLGYMISVLSIIGLYKNITFFSLIIPIVILGVPILDTTFAIIRRFIKKKPLSAPDKDHLHHCLINLGFSHRQTVVAIYALSALFGAAAVLFTKATVWGSAFMLVLLLVLIELIVEITGLVSHNYRPLLNLVATNRKK